MSGEVLTHGEAGPNRLGGGRAPRVWAGAVLVLAGVGLVGLGGCFFLGALLYLKPSLAGTGPVPALDGTGGGEGLYSILVGAGLLCLAGAVVTIFLGTRGLVRVLESRAENS